MFPTDYEKQNPLSKKTAIVNYFKKLEKMSLIDKYQSNYLINNVNKESYMDNYYKTSKNIGNILNSYEFQRQFVKSKRKYKFMKKIRQKKLSLEKSSSGFNTLTSNDTNKNIIETKLNTDNEIKSQAKKSLTYTNHLKNNMSTIKEEETPNNNDYDISTILAKNKPKREKTSQYMRQTLFQQIKNEGLYDESEEENEDDSLENDNNNNNNDNNILNNMKRNGLELSLISNGLNNINNINNMSSIKNKNFLDDNNNNNDILSDKKSDLSLYSIKTDYKGKNNNDGNINKENKETTYKNESFEFDDN